MFFIGKAGMNYIDRGSPATPDFDSGDLVKDADWHSLDLSGIIPAGAKLVALRTMVMGLATIGVLKVKKNGELTDTNIDVSGMETNGFPKYDTLWVTPDADGVIEYWLTAVAYISITVTVGGWIV